MRHSRLEFRLAECPGLELIVDALDVFSEEGCTVLTQDDLAAMTELNKRTVGRHLKWLEEHGYIVRQQLFKRNGARATTSYSIHFDKPSGHLQDTYKTPSGHLVDTPPL